MGHNNKHFPWLDYDSEQGLREGEERTGRQTGERGGRKDGWGGRMDGRKDGCGGRMNLSHFWHYCTHIDLYVTIQTGGIAIPTAEAHATRNDIVDVSSSTMAFNVAKIASSARSLTISLRVAGP